MFKQAVVGALMLVGGCSTISYVEPTEGPVAKVRFASVLNDLVVVRSYQDTDCNGEEEWMRLKNGILINGSPKSLNMPLSGNMHQNAFKEFLVSANKEQVFMFKGEYIDTLSIHSCAVPVKMVFAPNEMYQLKYRQNGGTCSTEVSRINKTDEGRYSLELIQTFNNFPYGFGEQCRNAFEKTRLY